MRLTGIIFSLTAIALFSFSSMKEDHSPAPTGPWKLLEDKNVSFAVDRDVIHLGNVRDQFRFLKLRVTDGPVRIYDMKVYFDNDQVQDVSMRMTIPQGGESRVINLDGGLRSLKKIEFTYETVGYKDGKSRVAVWGRR